MLRVAELSTVLKQQRAELDEKNALLEYRKIVKDHEEVIRMQEGQLLERMRSYRRRMLRYGPCVGSTRRMRRR